MGKKMKTESEVPALVLEDPYLKPFQPLIEKRIKLYKDKKAEIEKQEGSLANFALGYNKFGICKTKGGFVYREWAPGATSLSLIGDFNGWDPNSHSAKKDLFGVWTVELPNREDGKPQIAHQSKLKVRMTQRGAVIERIPAWLSRAVQDGTKPVYIGEFWNPEERYTFKHKRPAKPSSLRIYEAHVGMASIHAKIATYTEFKENMLPYVAKLGYNAIQLMAVQEHAYYASFGYQVTNFFAVSSRYGTPEELKSLIDEAHRLGIVMLLDVVHSHASTNVDDGLNLFDGSDHLYFHGGEKGYHKLWNSRLFNYSSWEVLRFLLSNLRWFVEEYQFDGFRFDGVMSMIYKHHGLAHDFSGTLDEYFGPTIDTDALTYLSLANDMLREVYPDVITIAEEVSGLPGLCRPLSTGGQGFDYRLAMSLPDLWIKLLKASKKVNS